MTLRVSVGFAEGVRPALRGRVGGGGRTVEKLVRDAVRATFAADSARDGVVSITLMTDEGIASLNERYLGHPGPTDVISFSLYELGEQPVGDIYIGLDQALRQAAISDTAAVEEISRLAVHGALHVLGHEHPDGPGRTRSQMWKMQERIVAGLGLQDGDGARRR